MLNTHAVLCDSIQTQSVFTQTIMRFVTDKYYDEKKFFDSEKITFSLINILLYIMFSLSKN